MILQPCAAPWGGSIAHGQSALAYLAPSVACGGECTSEQRTCNNGTLSGAYTNTACSPQACPPPVVIYSAAVDGAAETFFPTRLQFNGRMLNLGPANAQGCVETVGSDDGYCADLANWTTLPNGEWSFDHGAQVWRGVFPANAFPAGEYRTFARNSETGDAATPVVLTLYSTMPETIYSETVDGPGMTSFPLSQTFFGRMLNLNASNAQGCVEIVGTNDGYCENLGNWTTLPNAQWSYESSTGLWRGVFQGNMFPAGQYRSFARNSETGEIGAGVVFTLTQ